MNFDPTQYTPFKERDHCDAWLCPEASDLINKHILECKFAGAPVTAQQISDAALRYCMGLEEEDTAAWEELGQGYDPFLSGETLRHLRHYGAFPFSVDDEDSFRQWTQSMLCSYWVIHYLRNVIGEAS